MSSALHDFSVRQQMDAEFGRFKAGQIKRVAIAKENPRLWSKVRLMYNNVSVLDNYAIIQLVLNAPEDLLDQAFMDQIYAQMRKKLDYSVLTILKSRSVSFRTGCIAMTNLA